MVTEFHALHASEYISRYFQDVNASPGNAAPLPRHPPSRFEQLRRA
jgi:hypothetical protein